LQEGSGAVAREFVEGNRTNVEEVLAEDVVVEAEEEEEEAEEEEGVVEMLPAHVETPAVEDDGGVQLGENEGAESGERHASQPSPSLGPAGEPEKWRLPGEMMGDSQVDVGLMLLGRQFVDERPGVLILDTKVFTAFHQIAESKKGCDEEELYNALDACFPADQIMDDVSVVTQAVSYKMHYSAFIVARVPDGHTLEVIGMHLDSISGGHNVTYISDIMVPYLARKLWGVSPETLMSATVRIPLVGQAVGSYVCGAATLLHARKVLEAEPKELVAAAVEVSRAAKKVDDIQLKVKSSASNKGTMKKERQRLETKRRARDACILRLQQVLRVVPKVDVHMASYEAARQSFGQVWDEYQAGSSEGSA
jgi:hypothetical protein